MSLKEKFLFIFSFYKHSFIIVFGLIVFLFVVSSALGFDQNLFCANLGLDFAQCTWAMDYIENNSDVADCPDCNCSDPVNVSEIVEGLNFSCPVCEVCNCSEGVAVLPEDYDHIMWLLDQKNKSWYDVVDMALNPVECSDTVPCPECEKCADCSMVVDKVRCTDGGGEWDGSSCVNNNLKVTNFDPMTGATTTSAPSTTPVSYSNVKNRGFSTFVFFGVIILGGVFVFFKYVKPRLNKRKSRSSYGKDTPWDCADPSAASVKEVLPDDIPDYEQELSKKKNPKSSVKKVDLPVCGNKKCKSFGKKLVFDRSTKSWYCERCKFEVDA